ncbi:glutathione binding-like protein [Georgenia sp. SYP-B2076]|uniref:glutathione binding-like protein n=1 Tax=Georgenia sp. SYP-B2076 TaxID=2495881 RepID=UPI000F8D6660|nr:glutathione binding-like protein [Georgenia sp. SYP-B2076]
MPVPVRDRRGKAAARPDAGPAVARRAAGPTATGPSATASLLRAGLARLAPLTSVDLLPGHLECAVVEAIERLSPVVGPPGESVVAPRGEHRDVLERLDHHLERHRYLVGDRLTIADLHLWSVLVRVSEVPGGVTLVEDLRRLKAWSLRLCRAHPDLTGAVVADVLAARPGQTTP